MEIKLIRNHFYCKSPAFLIITIMLCIISSKATSSPTVDSNNSDYRDQQYKKEMQNNIQKRCRVAHGNISRGGLARARAISEILNELDGCNGSFGIKKSQLHKLSYNTAIKCKLAAGSWARGGLSRSRSYAKIKQLGGCNRLLSYL